MTVVIHLVNKNYIEIENSHNVKAVWTQIKNGEEIELDSWGNRKAIVNPDNVTTITVNR